MKRILVILVLLCAIGAMQAQPTKHVAIQQTLSAVGAGETFQFGGSYVGVGLRYHAISCQIFGGTVSASSLDLEGSNDKTTWTDIIAGLDCSSATSSAVTAGYARYLRLKLNTFTAATGAPYLDVYYAGYWDSPTTGGASTMQGVVNIPGSTYADGTTQTARLATDASIFVVPEALVGTVNPTYADQELKPLSVDTNGSLRTTVTNISSDIDEGSVVTSQAPITVGVQAVADDKAAVDAGDSVRLIADLNGKIIASPYAPFELYDKAYQIVSTDTAVDLKAATTGYRYCITSLVIYNSSATDTTLTLLEDTATVMGVYPAPSKGGVAISMPTPLCQAAVSHKLMIDEGETAADVHVTVTLYKQKR